MSVVEPPSSDRSDDKRSLPVTLVRSLVKQCREHVEAYAQNLINLLVVQIDRDLIKLAETTHEFSTAQRYNEAMRTLRSERENLLSQFMLCYSRQLSQALKAGGDNSVVDDDLLGGLSLVEDAQLEESLVVEQISSKVFEHCSDELFALEQRLELLFPGHNMDEGQIPFGASPLCNAFEEVLQPMELEIKVKLAMYRSLERTLLETVGDLFNELNELLRRADVLPEIKRKVKKVPVSPAVKSPPVEEHNVPQAQEANSAGEASGAPLQGEGINSVQGNSNGQGNGAAVGVHPDLLQLAGLFSEAVPSDPAQQQALVAAPVSPQLVEALSGLQISGDLLQAGAELSGEEFKARIKAQLSERKGGSADGVSRLDDETIDVISMIFDDLMEDEHLPDFIKALIGRLQIPVLKVALIDRVFFSEKEHPARQLLNELTLTGQSASIDAGDEKSTDLIHQKIESIVMKLIHEFQGDVAIFEVCLSELREFTEAQEAAFQAAQQALGEKVEKRRDEAKTKKSIAEEIAGRLLNRDVPDDIKRFLMETWREVLWATMQSEGDTNVALKRAEQACEDLIWSVLPINSVDEKKKLLMVVPLILDSLREGLESIGYTSAQIQAVNQMIERYHIANIKRGGKIETAPAAESPPQATDEIDQLLQDLEEELDLPAEERLGANVLSPMTPDGSGSGSGEFEKMMMEMGYDQSNDEGPQVSDRFTLLVDSLEVGVWVELIDDEGEVRRTKLAWKGDEFSKYAFVNWRYRVVAEKSYFALAEEFRQGNASLIEDIPLFDRAFDSVFTRIMQLAG